MKAKSTILLAAMATTALLSTSALPAATLTEFRGTFTGRSAMRSNGIAVKGKSRMVFTSNPSGRRGRLDVKGSVSAGTAKLDLSNTFRFSNRKVKVDSLVPGFLTGFGGPRGKFSASKRRISARLPISNPGVTSDGFTVLLSVDIAKQGRQRAKLTVNYKVLNEHGAQVYKTVFVGSGRLKE